MARSHFTVRRLEQVYGKAVVRTEQRVGTIIKIEPVSCDFEPSLCCQITDIENWRPETGA